MTPDIAALIRLRHVQRVELRNGLARKAGRSVTPDPYLRGILAKQAAPITKLTPRNVGTDSHAKGGSYENRIAKILMAWYGEGVTWTRSPKSGGWASASAFGVKGDLICNVKQPLHIECKNREGWFLDDLLTGVRQRDSRSIQDWWLQTMRDCPAGQTPVLIFRRNRIAKDLVMLRRDDLAVLGAQRVAGDIPYLTFGTIGNYFGADAVVILTLQDLVEKIFAPTVTR